MLHQHFLLLIVYVMFSKEVISHLPIIDDMHEVCRDVQPVLGELPSVVPYCLVGLRSVSYQIWQGNTRRNISHRVV